MTIQDWDICSCGNELTELPLRDGHGRIVEFRKDCGRCSDDHARLQFTETRRQNERVKDAIARKRETLRQEVIGRMGR